MLSFLLPITSSGPGTSSDTILFWVGILLIISAGSFIYVATLHILPEVLNDESSGDHGHGHRHGPKNEENDQNTKIDAQRYSKTVQLGVMVVGLVAPLALTFLEDA
jgi:zinc transporter ZupT